MWDFRTQSCIAFVRSSKFNRGRVTSHTVAHLWSSDVYCIDQGLPASSYAAHIYLDDSRDTLDLVRLEAVFYWLGVVGLTPETSALFARREDTAVDAMAGCTSQHGEAVPAEPAMTRDTREATADPKATHTESYVTQSTSPTPPVEEKVSLGPDAEAKVDARVVVDADAEAEEGMEVGAGAVAESRTEIGQDARFGRLAQIGRELLDAMKTRDAERLRELISERKQLQDMG